MESDCISTIEGRPSPESVRDVQELLGFTIYYPRFIWKYAKVKVSISNILMTQGSWKCEGTWDAKLSFWKLEIAITNALILQHSNPQSPIILQTNASGFMIAGMLYNDDGFGILRPVNFDSWTCSLAKQNYDTYSREILAIVETIIQRKHYVKGANQTILIVCDHGNLEYFQTSKVLSQRQRRWVEILSCYNFVVKHLEGKMILAYGPSRRPDYEIGYKRLTA